MLCYILLFFEMYIFGLNAMNKQETKSAPLDLCCFTVDAAGVQNLHDLDAVFEKVTFQLTNSFNVLLGC